MPNLIGGVRQAILTIDGVMAGESIFEEGHEAFFVDSRQMAGIFHGFVKLRLSWPVVRDHRERLRADARVEIPRSGTDWIIVKFRSEKDVSFVVELASLAAEQYRPPEGVPLRPPPTGADLARRRRWH
jgi:hypothetical protein